MGIKTFLKYSYCYLDYISVFCYIFVEIFYKITNLNKWVAEKVNVWHFVTYV